MAGSGGGVLPSLIHESPRGAAAGVCPGALQGIIGMVVKALVPAAGLGTRMRPATLAVDKELLTVVDRPAIDYVAMEAALAGVQELVLVCRDAEPAALAYLRARGDAYPVWLALRCACRNAPWDWAMRSGRPGRRCALRRSR